MMWLCYLGSIWTFGDHFRSHPVWSPHQRLSLWNTSTDLSTETKVWQLDLEEEGEEEEGKGVEGQEEVVEEGQVEEEEKEVEGQGKDGEEGQEEEGEKTSSKLVMI